jgi:hypothetical protein
MTACTDDGAVKGEGESHLDSYVPEVTKTYIMSKLASARAALQVHICTISFCWFAS